MDPKFTYVTQSVLVPELYPMPTKEISAVEKKMLDDLVSVAKKYDIYGRWNDQDRSSHENARLKLRNEECLKIVQDYRARLKDMWVSAGLAEEDAVFITRERTMRM
jgi:hypothetical protein